MAVQHTPAIAQATLNFVEWMKAFGWGFVSFPVVVYIVKTFGKQIWADLKALWAKYVSKTPTAV